MNLKSAHFLDVKSSVAIHMARRIIIHHSTNMKFAIFVLFQQLLVTDPFVGTFV